MLISSIVAMGKNRVIGKSNVMMWSIPSEYQHYRDTLADHFYIIGRKNYEGSFDVHRGQKALILTRQTDLDLPHPCFNDLKSAALYAKEKGERELFILGGAQIYKLAMPMIHRLYLSTVDFEEEGDAYFPAHENYQWQVTKEFTKGVSQDTPIGWSFALLEKSPIESI